MAERVECNYDEMQAIAKQLETEAEAINQVLTQTQGKAEGLHGDGWIGRGADQFFSEMQDLILPALTRLVSSLQQAATATTQISNIFKEAEEEAQNSFKSVG
jgi:WXG100 family type VII secretion target